MKTPIKWAALALGAASMIAMMELPAFADDSVSNSNDCQNVRTITTSHCVHYDEKKRDGWANQQAKQPTAPPVQKGPTVTVPDSGKHVQAPPTVTVPDWGVHVNYSDILSGKAARGGTAAGNGGSGGGRGGTSTR